jgi:hypothetical protein
MRKPFVAAGAVCLLVALGTPAGAYHIVGDDGTGANRDPVTGLHSDDWLLGGIYPLLEGSGDVAGRACENSFGDGGLQVADCHGGVNGLLIDVAEATYMCENDETPLRPANAGHGGRCFSSAQVGQPTVPGIGDWTRMDVTADGASACNPTWTTNGAAFYARVGSDVNGAITASGDSFFYRTLTAYWVADGHVTYVPNAQDAQVGGGILAGCFGSDVHADGSSVTTNSSALCNSTDRAGGVDPFDPSTYIGGAPGDDQTVCVG